jgi:hypothetical protein
MLASRYDLQQKYIASTNLSIRSIDNNLECASFVQSLGSREMVRYILIVGDY